MNIDKENNDIINGWEYLCDIKPTVIVNEQKLQNDYLEQYNLSYDNFIKSLCFDKDALDSITNTNTNDSKYRFFIDVNEDNDVINNNNDYPIKFLKSKFILYKYKKIKTDLISYYKPLGFYVKGPFKININNTITKYIIELYWNNNNNNNESYA